LAVSVGILLLPPPEVFACWSRAEKRFQTVFLESFEFGERKKNWLNLVAQKQVHLSGRFKAMFESHSHI
jgi:hypothetical protein